MQVQFLLFFLATIPLIGVVAVSFVRDYPRVLNKVTFALVAIFILNAFAIFNSYVDNNYAMLDLFSMSRDLHIGLLVTPLSLIFLALVSIVWLVLTVYGNRYFALSRDGRLFWFQIFLILSVEFTVLILFSKNLISLFLFYQSLIFTIYFFNTYFMHQSDIKASYNFTFFSSDQFICFLFSNNTHL